MKTMFFEEMRAPEFDNDLLMIINLSDSGMVIGDNEKVIRFGVQNEDGEIYRIVAADDVLEFTHNIKRLQTNHWPIENLQLNSKRSFHAIVKPPEKLQLRALGIYPDDPGSAI